MVYHIRNRNHINPTPGTMKLSRSFSINFNGTPVQIDAEISFTAYQIMRATCPAGRPFDVSLDPIPFK